MLGYYACDATILQESIIPSGGADEARVAESWHFRAGSSALQRAAAAVHPPACQKKVEVDDAVVSAATGFHWKVC